MMAHSLENIMCKQCGEGLIDNIPRKLNCDHSFCESCLQELLRDGQLVCPRLNCSNINYLNDVKELPIFDEIVEIKAKQRELQEKERELKRAERRLERKQKEFLIQIDSLCYLCFANDKKKMAVGKCLQCLLSFCSTCTEVHNRYKAFENHPFLIYEDTRQVCVRHKLLKLYVCTVCSVALCLNCVFSPEHKNHADRIEYFKSGISSLKCEIREQREKLSRLLNDVEVAVAKLESGRDNKSSKEAVINHQSDLNDSFAKQMDRLIDKLKHVCSVPLQEKELLHSIQEELKELAMATENVLQRPPKEILRDSKTLHTQLCTKLDEASCQLGQSYSVPRFTLDFKYACDLMGTVKFNIKQYQRVPSILQARKANKFPVKCLHLDKSLDPESALTMSSPATVTQFGQTLLYIDEDVSFVQRINSNGDLVSIYSSGAEKSKILGLAYAFVYDSKIYAACKDIVYVIPFSPDKEHTLYKPAVRSIRGMAMLRPNTLIMTDNSLNQVLLFDMEKATTKVILKELADPQDVLTASTATGTRCIISELVPKTVTILDVHDTQENPTRGKKIVSLVKGPPGKDFKSLNRIQLSGQNTLLVCDSLSHCITEYDLKGEFLRYILTRENGLVCPCCVAYQHPSVWVVDSDPSSTRVVLKMFQMPQ